MTSSVAANETLPLLSTSQSRRRSSIVACILIAVSQGFERVVFWGVLVSLPTVLGSYPLCWTTENTNSAQLIYLGITFWLSFLVGYISDAFLPRVLVIASGFLLHFLGFIYPTFMCLTYYPTVGTGNLTSNCANISTKGLKQVWSSSGENIAANGNCLFLIIISGLLIAIGSAALRTNLAPFGADQVNLVI